METTGHTAHQNRLFRKKQPASVVSDLITGHKDHLYKQLMANDGFLKTFFKLLKEGRKTGAIHNVFITGVLPVTIDELASGFNIAHFITLEPEFENMLGFTQTEVNHLLDEIYRDYRFDPATRAVTECERFLWNIFRREIPLFK